MVKPAPILKPLRLLEDIASAEHAPSLAHLTARAGQPKATLHRWLATLESAGLVQRTPDGRRYELGERATRLAFSILSNQAGSKLRHEILQRVVKEIGETCNLTILQGTQVVYLDRVEAMWPLRITFQRGSKVPAYCSASGKLFLALMTATKRSQLLQEIKFTRFTENTITDQSALQQEITTIRKNRYSLDREEFLSGLACIAVPIFQGSGRARSCVAALAVQAPVSRLSYKDMPDKLPILQEAAQAFAATLE